jgi:hypothetical protein
VTEKETQTQRQKVKEWQRNNIRKIHRDNKMEKKDKEKKC